MRDPAGQNIPVALPCDPDPDPEREPDPEQAPPLDPRQPWGPAVGRYLGWGR